MIEPKNNSEDLKPFLDAWPFDPDNNVQVTSLADGRQVMQVRLPLGVEQYELDGRPDGERPHGMTSALEYQQSRLKAADKGGSVLSPSDCAELFEEGVLYYYRYLHLFQIEDWDRTARDADRNLLLFDFVNAHAEEEDDRMYLEQWRPYILRVRAISLAMLAMKGQRYEEALGLVNEAIEKVEALKDIENPTFDYERQRSLTALRDLASRINVSKPYTEEELLEKELQKAVEAEEYEQAASLRDRIHQMRAEGGEPGTS